MTAEVTVVVVTRDRCDDLEACLRRLHELPERPRTIVVDNGSRDGTVPHLRERWPGVELIEMGHNAGAAGRNAGVEAATTEIVAFADDDSGWEPGALARAAELFAAHPRLAALAALVLNGDRREPDPTCRSMSESPLPSEDDLPGTPVLGFLACGSVVHRRRFLAVGGFDARYGIGGEETPLAVDLVEQGWGVAYVPDVVARHWPAARRDTGHRRRLIVRNDLWFAWGRRRWRSIAVVTARHLRNAVSDRATRRGVIDAVRGAGPILTARRALPAELDRQLRLVS